MNEDRDLRRLLCYALISAIMCAVLVLVCYAFVDRVVAFWVHDHGIADHAALKWLTYPPPIVQAWVPAILMALVIRRIWGLFYQWELMLLAACVALVLADQFRESLAYVFGRYWPETWIDDNPSLIRNGAYGFHPLHGGVAYRSLPSGHTARTVAAASVVWIVYRRWRWACVLAVVAEAVGLVGMNYHFVGDVVAGGYTGAIVGVFTAHFFGLNSVHSIDSAKHSDSAFSP